MIGKCYADPHAFSQLCQQAGELSETVHALPATENVISVFGRGPHYGGQFETAAPGMLLGACVCVSFSVQ